MKGFVPKGFKAAAFASALLLASTPLSSAAGGDLTAIVTGSVAIGPLCSGDVSVAPQPCPNVPPDFYSSRKLILRPEAGNPIEVQLRPDGTFQIELSPGMYQVNLTNCDAQGCKYVKGQSVDTMPDHTTRVRVWGVPQKISINPGRTKLLISIDTGVR